MISTVKSKAAGNTEAATTLDRARILAIDAELDQLLDRNLRQSVAELTQGAMDLVHDPILVESAYRLGYLESERTLAEWEPMGIRCDDQTVSTAGSFDDVSIIAVW